MKNDNKRNSKPKQKNLHKSNLFESFRDIGTSTANIAKKDLLNPIPKDIASQLFGRRPQKKFEGEILPGEPLEMQKVYTGEQEKNEKLAKQLKVEKRLRQELETKDTQRKQELALELHAVKQEVAAVAEALTKLDHQVEIAVFQSQTSEGVSVYEKFFLANMIAFLKSFAAKLEHANTWLMQANKRAAKKNRWGQNFKKHGAKYLLSGEHYASRSGA